MADARRRILDASIELVAREGVRAVSFREVARKAGVSHQTPYHHFGNHLGILEAIAREGFEGLTRAMRDAAASERDPLEALAAAGIAYVEFAREHVGHFRVMFQRDLFPDGNPLPEGESTYAFLVELVTKAHKHGAGKGLGVELTSRLCWSTVHGLAVLSNEGALRTKSAGPKHEELVRQTVHGLSRLLGRSSK